MGCWRGDCPLFSFVRRISVELDKGLPASRRLLRTCHELTSSTASSGMIEFQNLICCTRSIVRSRKVLYQRLRVLYKIRHYCIWLRSLVYFRVILILKICVNFVCEFKFVPVDRISRSCFDFQSHPRDSTYKTKVS